MEIHIDRSQNHSSQILMSLLSCKMLQQCLSVIIMHVFHNEVEHFAYKSWLKYNRILVPSDRVVICGTALLSSYLLADCIMQYNINKHIIFIIIIINTFLQT